MGRSTREDNRESRSPRQGRERSRESPFGNQDPCWFLQPVRWVKEPPYSPLSG